MASTERLQQRPEIQLAIGQLASIEQTHVQICLRAMAPRMKVPCVAVKSQEAELTLGSVPGNPEMARLSSKHSHQDLERPLRMVPLSDALTHLIDELLAQDSSVVQAITPQRRSTDPGLVEAQPQGEAPTASASQRLLLQALFDRAHNSPVQLRTASGIEILVDPNYHSAWLSAEIENIPATIADEVVVSAQSVGLGTFQERISNDHALRPIQVEQLCWLGSGATGVATPLDRWLEEGEAVLRLQTWPNLSAQPDYPLWLQVLPAMWNSALRMDEAVQRLEALGMPRDRARHGMALLCLFRHAKRDTSVISSSSAVIAPAQAAAVTPAAAPVSTPAPSAPAPQTEKKGLLGRLKSRLRSMLG